MAVFFALYGRVAFLCLSKEKVPKERPPYRVGLRLLCALHIRAGAAELAIAQTVLALFRSKPAVLDNTKGARRSKQRSKPVRWRLIQYYKHRKFLPSYRRMPVSRNCKKNGFRLETCRNDDRSLIYLWFLVFSPLSLTLTLPFRPAEKHRMGWGFRDVLSER